VRKAVRLTPLLLLALAAPVGASVFTVTKTADTLDGACNTDCSLREAVTAANASPGADSIHLGPGVYSLTRLGPFEDGSATGDLDVQGELTILGAGADRTILDGGLTDRLLEVQPEGTLELRGATVRNGWARVSSFFDGQGGGIRAVGRLTLVDCLLSNNRAETGGGVFGLYLTVRGTTFTGNSAVSGGGLFSGFGLDMENVTLAGNTGRYGGGAMLEDAEAGLRVSHVTIAGNEATSTGGGIYLDSIACPAGIPECPTGPFLRLDRSIVAGNTAPQNPDCAYMAHLGLNNVFGPDDGCSPVIGDRSTPDPKLSPLGAYGGLTPTRPPLPGSPAVDLAPGYLCSGTDQRGAIRPVDGDGDGVAGCDAGAVEAGSACQAGGSELCLGEGDRFRVTARWTTRDGSGPARSLPLTRDTGAFWFFNPANLEIVLKVLDGCAVNDRYWVFLSGLTNVGVEVTVRDTLSGKTWTDSHPAGTALPARLDTDALDICPENP
jgi:CSLREA domain-containing protein